MSLGIIRAASAAISRSAILSQLVPKSSNASFICRAALSTLANASQSSNLSKTYVHYPLVGPRQIDCLKPSFLGIRHLATSVRHDEMNGFSSVSKDVKLLNVVKKGITEEFYTACQFLLEQGANPNYRGHLGRNALHIATNNGVPCFCELFLEFGANPNIPDEFGFTAFHLAIIKGDHEIAKLLLEYGANLDIPAGDKNVLELTDDLEMINLILRYRIQK